MARDMDELQTVSRDDVSQPKAPPVVSARRCPALQDIHGDVANILARSVNCSSEETMTELFNAVNLADLREARSVLFGHVTGYVLEHEDAASGDLDCFRLKQRRCVKAGLSLALNIVKPFNYMCGLDCSFPGSVLASKGPTSASLLAGPPAPRQQSPTLTPHCSPLKDPCPGSHQEVSLSPPLTPASQELPCAQPQGAKASSPVSQSQRTSPGHSTSKLSDSPFGLMGSPQTITSSFSLPLELSQMQSATDPWLIHQLATTNRHQSLLVWNICTARWIPLGHWYMSLMTELWPLKCQMPRKIKPSNPSKDYQKIVSIKLKIRSKRSKKASLKILEELKSYWWKLKGLRKSQKKLNVLQMWNAVIGSLPSRKQPWTHWWSPLIRWRKKTKPAAKHRSKTKNRKTHAKPVSVIIIGASMVRG